MRLKLELESLANALPVPLTVGDKSSLVVLPKQEEKISGCIVSKSGWEGDIYRRLSHKAGLNKGSTSRANMGTSVIYFCRLVLMAYSELPLTMNIMLTTKKLTTGMIV